MVLSVTFLICLFMRCIVKQGYQVPNEAIIQ